MVLLIVVTAGASALLDNVTTVLLVAPVTLMICEKLGLRPVLYLTGASSSWDWSRPGSRCTPGSTSSPA
ncbi:SLC13 family permease [Modestobacter sp. I12A-02662]|uniref:SLC13 family permease n=1 Tax=Modestobacter sp. I12A-02662 TaxID=1730496 RepID=UPI0034DF10CB